VEKVEVVSSFTSYALMSHMGGVLILLWEKLYTPLELWIILECHTLDYDQVPHF
jgi:hypothetical protein